MKPNIMESNAVVFIPLTQGKVAVIDFEDFEKVRPYKWYANKVGQRFYAGRNLHGPVSGSISMHREIMQPDDGLDVHHVDGDGLNNQRNNLRVCTRSENMGAFRRLTANKTSKFRGVSWYSRDSNWEARIKIFGKKLFLGRFATEEDAANAYDKKSRELFGEFSYSNLP